METALAVKNVDFYGDNLLAAQDKQGKIWAGVKWMCQGIGLTDDQMKHERKKIQSDLVLKQGGSNLTLPTNSGIQSVLCLYLDYVPLWLAKISITPKMKKDSPKVVEKLINYQLKAKDVLAQAFLPQYQESTGVPKNVQDYIDQCVDQRLISYVEPLHNDFNRNMNMIYNAFIGVQKALPQIASIQSISFGDKEWKQKQFNTINELLKECPEYKKCNLVLRKIYSKMRNQYGVVFEQEYKDYCKRHNVSGHIPVIEVVSDKEMLRSIFSSILDDLFVLPKEIIKKSKRQSIKSNINNVVDNNWLREPLKPLIKKYNDNSAHSNMTFRRVYKEMANMGVCWHNRQVRYKNKYNLKNYPLKSKLIRNNHALYDIFYKAIENLLTE
jgi:hypothetical protein